jgi:low affinity Fe/Cu permease
MVFLIQHTQNRDTDAIHIKLDEVIRSIRGANNAIVSLEDLDDHQLEVFRKRYAAIAEAARNKARKGQHDTSAPDVLVVDAAVAAESERRKRPRARKSKEMTDRSA